MKIKNRSLFVCSVITCALVLASVRPSLGQEKKTIRMVFVSQLYNLYAPALTADLSLNIQGFQFMLDEDKRNGLIDGKMTVDRVISARLLKAAQQELRAEGRLK